MSDLKKQIADWCDANMERRSRPDEPYARWEKDWLHGYAHECHKLRIMETDASAWIILVSASASVAGDESQWHGVCLGSAGDVGDIHAAFNLLERMADLDAARMGAWRLKEKSDV